MRKQLQTKYHAEREDICNTLITILELDEKHSILFSDLENDVEKQTKILDMKNEIQKYFARNCFSPYNPSGCKRPYVNILRAVLRQQGYTFTASPILIGFEDGKSVSTLKYTITRSIYRTL